MYEATINDLICIIMQIISYQAWLKEARSEKGPNKAELQLCYAQQIGDFEMILEAVNA